MMQDKKKALGRGLESLLPKRPAATPQVPPAIAAAIAVKPGNGAATQIPPAAEAHPGNGHAGAAIALANATKLEASVALQAVASDDQSADGKIRMGEMVIMLPLTAIERNPYQTRFTAPDDAGLAELADSIKVHGVMQPVVVVPLKQSGAQGTLYHLVAGERRWLASKLAGKTHIPAIVRVLTAAEIAVLTIIENLLRQDLNPMQHARAFLRLAEEFRLTQEEIAQRTGVSRSAVANYLRLTRMPEFAQRSIEEGKLSFGHAKVLVPLVGTESLELCVKKVLAMRLSVRETEQLVEEFLRPAVTVEKPERKIDANVRAAQDELARTLGCRVQISDRNGRGKIVIEYKSLEDFDRVLEALK